MKLVAKGYRNWNLKYRYLRADVTVYNMGSTKGVYVNHITKVYSTTAGWVMVSMGGVFLFPPNSEIDLNIVK